MGTKLSEIEIGTPVSLHVSSNAKSMRLEAIVKKIISENTILITLQCDINKKLNFSTVKTDLEFYPSGNIPIKWYDVKIASSQTDYVVQADCDGSKLNRRNTFRVGVSATAYLKTPIPNCPGKVTVRDISLTGFSISDRKGELPFAIGNTISISWNDLDYELNLIGRLIRIENRDDVTIFGFEICNICKDLSSYISTKQRQQRNN